MQSNYLNSNLVSEGKTVIWDISTDLTWIDMLKGIAIIGVFFDNWLGYMKFTKTPILIYSLMKLIKVGVGPFVQVFFILSGFGLTIAYLNHAKINWSWEKWVWRRITKIVIPYEIFVIVSFMLGIVGLYLHESISVEFSWKSFFAYLTFTRNLYSPSWTWNPPLWFMPVIIGLYICFPIFIKIMDKWGPGMLILIAIFLTYGSLIIAALAGATGGHSSDLFTFWLVQFALGMVIALVREKRPQRLRLLLGPWAISLGIVFYLLSWILRTYIPLGKVFNDSFTSIGIFLILLNLGWAIRAAVPAVGRIFYTLSTQSYFMFLIHYPIMKFLIGPPLRVPMNPIVVAMLGGVYIVVIFFLCQMISKPINKLTFWLYQQRNKSPAIS